MIADYRILAGLLVGFILVAIPAAADTVSWENPAVFRALIQSAAARLAATHYDTHPEMAEAEQAYLVRDFPAVLRLTDDSQAPIPFAAYIRARALGYCGRFHEAYAYVRAMQDRFPGDPQLAKALCIATHNLGSVSPMTTDAVRDEIAATVRDKAQREFLLGRFDYYAALSDPRKPDRELLRSAIARFLHAIANDPQPAVADTNLYCHLLSAVSFLGMDEHAAIIVRALLLEHPEIVNRWQLELELDCLDPLALIDLSRAIRLQIAEELGNHPHQVLAVSIRAEELDAGVVDRATLAAKLEAAAADWRVAGYPEMQRGLLYHAGYHRILQNDAAAALADYRRIQAISPEYAQIRDNLAIVYDMLGDTIAAAAEYQKALANNYRGRGRLLPTIKDAVQYFLAVGWDGEAVRWGVDALVAMAADGQHDQAIAAGLRAALESPTVMDAPDLQDARRLLASVLNSAEWRPAPTEPPESRAK